MSLTIRQGDPIPATLGAWDSPQMRRQIHEAACAVDEDRARIEEAEAELRMNFELVASLANMNQPCDFAPQVFADPARTYKRVQTAGEVIDEGLGYVDQSRLAKLVCILANAGCEEAKRLIHEAAKQYAEQNVRVEA